MFANTTDFISENNAFMSKITVNEGDPLRYNQKLPIEFLKHYKNSRGLLLFQKMGAGKTRIGNAIANNFQEEGYKIIMISSKSLHENTKAEQIKYLKDIGKENIDEVVKKHYKFVSLNASNMIHQVFKAVRQEGEEMFSQVIEGMFKQSSNKKHTPKLDESLESSEISESEENDRGAALRDIKKHIEKVNALINLDKCVVIMDEAHDFFNSVVNGSKNATALYYLLLYSNNSKIIFMSGSPIVNDPFEITVPINILGGIIDGETVFGENYETFYKYFVSNPGISQEDGEVKQSFLKNREKFMDRISGMVSYFGADSPEFLALLPEPAPLTIRRVPMSDKQFSAYASSRDREIEATLRKAGRRVMANPMTKPKGAGSTYRVMSRQISNVLYPDYATTMTKNAYGNMLTAKHLDKLDASFFAPENIKLHSCKIYELLTDLSKCLPDGYLQFPQSYKGKGDKKTEKKVEKKVEKKTVTQTSKEITRGPALVYSQFVESGVGVIAKALTHYGFKEYSDMNRGDKSPKFAMMMGEVDFDVRKKYEDIYNSEENRDGSLIAVLLVTVTAAQGINLFTCTNEFMLEPYWHLSRHDQFFARAVRPGSLSYLPKEKRVVGRYLYLADYPKSPLLKEDAELDAKKIKTIMETEKTTDVTLYAKAVLRKILINSVLSATIDGSIDCYANYNGSKSVSCRVCKPTGRSLYARNLLTDMKNPSPCVPIVTAEVAAKKVEVNGIVYAYTLNPFKVFKYNKNTDSYQEITALDEEYYDVTKQIKK